MGICALCFWIGPNSSGKQYTCCVQEWWLLSLGQWLSCFQFSVPLNFLVEGQISLCTCRCKGNMNLHFYLPFLSHLQLLRDLQAEKHYSREQEGGVPFFWRERIWGGFTDFCNFCNLKAYVHFPIGILMDLRGKK